MRSYSLNRIPGRSRFSSRIVISAIISILLVLPADAQSSFIEYQEPEFLAFDELKTLSSNPHPGGALGKKLERFWATPVISNRAYYRRAKPIRPVSPELGPYLRLVSWNIEKSFLMRDAITVFASPSKFPRLIDTSEIEEGSDEYADVLRQRNKLSLADVIVLQEMDIGVKRSNYINAAAELAGALNMNYAYGTEQLEVDPVMLGTEKLYYEGGAVDQEATDYYTADPLRYKGAFGCAVLSRYPIKAAKVFQLKNQAYDWYAGEKRQTSFLEEARRFGSKVVFKNELTREMKVGGRIFFRVDLEVPELPDRTLTIINIHLEIKCLPEGREKQMREILSYIAGIKNPVIMVGDFNSAPTDLSPTSTTRILSRTAKDPETWVSAATSVLLPNALVINATRLTSKYTKNLQDPLAKDIPVLSPNPCKPLFEMIEDFRFLDGKTFDFRGDKKRSVNGKKKTLANSNQRDFKGFKTTFQVKRPLGPIIGKYRLDWVFVKSFLTLPKDKEGSYRFAPHFGETLEEMNTSLINPVSDHHPNVVDIPFEEPNLT